MTSVPDIYHLFSLERSDSSKPNFNRLLRKAYLKKMEEQCPDLPEAELHRHPVFQLLTLSYSVLDNSSDRDAYHQFQDGIRKLSSECNHSKTQDLASKQDVVTDQTIYSDEPYFTRTSSFLGTADGTTANRIGYEIANLERSLGLQ